MSKKIDIEKACEIIRNGFVLPAEIEEFFTTAKARAVESVLKIRAEGKSKMDQFNATWREQFNALPADQKITRDGKFVNGKFTTFERPIAACEWHTREHSRIAKEIPFYGRTDADAVKFTEEDCDMKRVQFIIRTNAITGDTITAAALMIDHKSGDVNGTITGANGTATVKTIGAGGYNIQCYHFRCLIREAK